MSQFADSVEAAQCSSPIEALEKARAMLDDQDAGRSELRITLARTIEALSNVLRLAQSRAARLPASYCADDDVALNASGDEDDDPHHSAGASG
jgi:hypothetical protein